MSVSTNRIAVCSWSLQPAGIDELVCRLQRLGMDQVQLALSPLVSDPGSWDSAINRLKDAGIRIISGMMATEGEDYTTLESIARTGGLRPNATWPANREHAEEVANLAARHLIRLVTFHAGFIPEDPGDPERAILIERLRTVADMFAGRGIQLGLETGQETASTLLDVLAAIDRPSIGVNFDPANMILYDKGDPVRALEKLSPHVVQIHIKDAIPTETPEEWGEEVPVGHGAVDWAGFFETAGEIHPPVNLVVEREAGDQRESDIRSAAEFVRKHMTAAVSGRR